MQNQILDQEMINFGKEFSYRDFTIIFEDFFKFKIICPQLDVTPRFFKSLYQAMYFIDLYLGYRV